MYSYKKESDSDIYCYIESEITEEQNIFGDDKTFINL